MSRILVKNIKSARILSKEKRTEIYLSVLDIANLDSGKTLIFTHGDLDIILTCDKYPLDTTAIKE